VSDQDDLRVTPYLPDESLDGSLGQASADAPQFVGPGESLTPTLPPAVPPTLPLPAGPPAVTPESFVLASFPTWQDPRPFPSNAKDHLGFIAMVCGIASVVILFGGAAMASNYINDPFEMAGVVFAFCWLGLWFVTSVCAIVFAVFGLRAARERLATNRGMSLVGLVIGALMVVALVAVVTFTIG